MKSKNIKNQKTLVENSNMTNENIIPLKAPPKEFKIDRRNFEEFCKLDIDNTIKSTDENDLPSEFSEETYKFIDMFRRKTKNEKKEWEFYIDYENNEIIHCFNGKPTNVTGWINVGLMKNRHICSVHNHIKGTYSPPSAANFEILDHEFEKFEIICAEEEYWILEANGIYEKEYVNNLKKEIKNEFDKCDLGIYRKNIHEKYDPNKEYSKRLYELINNLNNNIYLKIKEYR